MRAVSQDLSDPASEEVSEPEEEDDILSFYKEELAHETGNYVHLRAAVVGRKPTEVVYDLVEEALREKSNIEAVLKDDKAALGAWRSFMTGYVWLSFVAVI